MRCSGRRARPVRISILPGVTNDTGTVSRFGPKQVGARVNPTIELARCLLLLADLPNFALDRLSRYDTAGLWHQVGQVLFALDVLDRRKPQERRGRFDTASQPERASYERGDGGNFKGCT